MKVVGTAGHVDHGKSALVLALTGINPDRLREEQERQMTIDLGFAWLTLPDGEVVGIIDVPGHSDFIENMLAGVGGIDAALFIIAADEGVMPQSREHLAILDLLHIERGVVAITKSDLVNDSDWLDLVSDDVKTLLRPTTLQDAPVVHVSAHNSSGLEDLVEAIQAVLSETPARRDIGQPRLSIDRAFSISGFGTVVTGTLIDGKLSVGDELEILPKGLKGRVRGLQTHKEKIDSAIPGSRVAVNISGVNVDDLNRGDVVMHPGTGSSTFRIDVHLEHLNSSEHPIVHNQEVKLFIGAAQRVARVRLLGADELLPGEEGWLQLELKDPVVTARGDRYIIRRPSPPATIGGGQVVDAHPERRHRRMDNQVIDRLEQYLVGEPRDLLIQSLQRYGPIDGNSITEIVGIDSSLLDKALKETLADEDVLALEGGAGEEIFIDSATWRKLAGRIQNELEAFHSENNLRMGMSVEELRSRLKLGSRTAAAVIKHAEEIDLIKSTDSLVKLSGFAPELSEAQSKSVERLLVLFENDPYSTPSVKETIKAVGPEVYQYLVSTGILLPVSDDVVFTRDGFESMVNDVKELFDQQSELTVAAIRDHLGTTRKYVLALMEYLDGQGVTVREGDRRRLASN